MYLRTSNGIYFEVGELYESWRDQKWSAIDYSEIAGHKTYVNSLMSRPLRCGRGSMVRVNKKGVIDVGPRSAHIAGL